MENTKGEAGETSSQYLAELLSERDALDGAFPHAARLFAEEIERIQKKTPEKEKMLELHEDKPTAVSVKVRLPVKEFPDIKFAGRIIGTRGAEMKKFQEKTGTRLFVFGKGSMVDKKKEEELRLSGGRFEHLNEDLHVQLKVFAHPVEAYRRISLALHELRAYMNAEVPAGHTNGGSGAQPSGFLPPQAPAMLHGPGPVGPGPIPGPHGVPAMQGSLWPARYQAPPAAQWPMYPEAGPHGMRTPYPEQSRPGYPARGAPIASHNSPAANWSSYPPSYPQVGMTHHPAAGDAAGQYRVHPYGRGTAAPNGWGPRG